MFRRIDTVFAALAASAAVMPSVPALAQFAPPPPAVYRGDASPPAYRDRWLVPSWADEDEDDQPIYPRRRIEPRYVQQQAPGMPSRITPDDSALPPPGLPPQGLPPQMNAPAANSDVIRPPAPIGAAPAAPVAPSAAKEPPPVSVATLPPEDQPETGDPKELAPNLKRQLVDYPTKEPAGTIVVDTPNTYLYLVLGNGKAMRYGVRVGREGFTWTGTERVSQDGRMAGLASARGDDRAPALSAALHGRRPGQSAWRARDVSRQDGVPHPRHQPAFDHRQIRVVGLRRHAQ